MNTLYLTYDGLTDPLGQSQILPYIIGLSRKGHSFTIVSFEKKDRFHLNKNRIEEICQSENIQWHPLSYTKNPPVLATVFDVWKLNKIGDQWNTLISFDQHEIRKGAESYFSLSGGVQKYKEVYKSLIG